MSSHAVIKNSTYLSLRKEKKRESFVWVKEGTSDLEIAFVEATPQCSGASSNYSKPVKTALM